MSDIDGPTFVRILKALEKYSSMIPPQQLAMLRSQETLQIFESTKPMNLLAMVMPDDNKIILTLGRKSFDMSMFIKKIGFKVVDGTDYLMLSCTRLFSTQTVTSPTTRSSSQNWPRLRSGS